MGLAYSAHAQAVLRCSPAERYGAATASMQLFDNLGVALGTGAVGVVVTTGDDLGWDPGRTVALALIGPVVVALVGAAMSRRFPGDRAGLQQRPAGGLRRAEGVSVFGGAPGSLPSRVIAAGDEVEAAQQARWLVVEVTAPLRPRVRTDPTGRHATGVEVGGSAGVRLHDWHRREAPFRDGSRNVSAV